MRLILICTRVSGRRSGRNRLQPHESRTGRAARAAHGTVFDTGIIGSSEDLQAGIKPHADQQLIPQGHKIRVQISCAFYPHYSRNLQTGKSEIVSGKSQVAHVKIYHEAQHPSKIVLPIIPNKPAERPNRGERRFSTSTACGKISATLSSDSTAPFGLPGRFKMIE